MPGSARAKDLVMGLKAQHAAGAEVSSETEDFELDADVRQVVLALAVTMGQQSKLSRKDDEALDSARQRLLAAKRASRARP